MKRIAWAGISLALLLGASSAPAQRLDGIAAVVNDDVVLQSDVEEQLYLFLMRAQVRPDSMTVDTLRQQILKQLIDEKLIVAEAKRQGISVSDAEVNREVDDAIKDVKQRVGGDEAYREQLARENTTEEKLRDKYRADLQRQLLAQRLVQKQLPKKTVTAAEAEAYFKEHKAEFPKIPSELRLQVIQIRATPDSATEAKAKAKIAAARKRIVGGERFAKVAAEVSEDQSSSRSGGDLGFVVPATLDSTLETAVLALSIGQVSQPIRSPFGWHLIEVLERDTTKTRAGRDSLGADGKPVVELHLRHVLVRAPITEADAERAKKLAERTRAEAVKGADFGALVRRYSKYEGPQSPDGDLGFVSLGALQPSIRAGLEPLKVGEISPVLVNPVGFNIFKVLDRKPEREYQLEEIRDELPEVVSQMKQRDRYEEWMKGLRAKAHVEIKNS